MTRRRKLVFSLDNRRISHGCIRVQDPLELAALLMREPTAAIRQGIAMGGTTRHALPTPMPVFVVYQTAFVDGVRAACSFARISTTATMRSG